MLLRCYVSYTYNVWNIYLLISWEDNSIQIEIGRQWEADKHYPTNILFSCHIGLPH